jgi:WD40 repeat protein
MKYTSSLITSFSDLSLSSSSALSLSSSSVVNPNTNNKNINININGVLISGHNKGQISVYNIENFKLISKFREHTQTIWDLKYYLKTKFISASSDYTVKIWDLDSKKSIKTIKYDCTCFYIEPLFNFNLSYLAISCYDRRVHIYNVTTETKLDSFLSDTDNIAQRVFYLSKIRPFNLMLTLNYNKIKLWNLDTMMITNHFEGHKGWIYGIDYIDNDLFCTSGHDKTIRIWNVHQKKAVKLIIAHSDNINCVFSLYKYLGNHVILTGSTDKNMKLIDLDKEIEYFTLYFDEEIFLCSQYIEENEKKISFVTLSKNNSKEIKIWRNFLKSDI